MFHRLNKSDKKTQLQNNDITQLLNPPPIVCLKKAPANPADNHIYLTEQLVPIEIKKIIVEVEKQFQKGEILTVTQLLRKGKEIIKYSKQKINNNIILVNLAICYYKIGLLEESFNEFMVSANGLKQVENVKKVALLNNNLLIFNLDYYCSLFNRLKLKRIRGRICLQVCILFSQLGKHDLAIKHAKIGCKIYYNMAFDLLILLNGIILKFLNETKYTKIDKKNNNNQNSQNQTFIDLPQIFDRMLNLIGILTHLFDISKDLKEELLTKGKEAILATQYQALDKYGKLDLEIDFEEFMKNVTENDWILKNKILNQIQMENIKREEYQESSAMEVTNNTVLETISYLAISFYCLSTEARFNEKSMNMINTNQILDSEHWLSNSLEIAYTFLPHEAPMLGQIYSVHSKFHGIDKQAIPQDKQMQGSVKILKPLRKANSIYYANSNLLSPILIRIQTPKITLIQEVKQKSRDTTINLTRKVIQGNNITINFDNTGVRNKPAGKGVPKKLEFLNSLEKIYKHQLNKTASSIPKIDNNVKKQAVSVGKKKNITTQNLNKSTIEEGKRPRSNDQFKSKKIEFETIQAVNGLQQTEKLKRNHPTSKTMDMQINPNINLFIMNQMARPSYNNEQNNMSIQGQYTTKNDKKQNKNNKKISGSKLTPHPGDAKQIGKRNLYYGRRRLSANSILQQANISTPLCEF